MEQVYEYSSYYNWYWDIPTEIPADEKQVSLRHLLHQQIRLSKNIRRKLKKIKPTLHEWLVTKKAKRPLHKVSYRDALIEPLPKKKGVVFHSQLITDGVD
jgi:hypothetical protein